MTARPTSPERPEGPDNAIPARQPGLQPPRSADTECCRSVLGIRANLKHTVEVELDFNYK